MKTPRGRLAWLATLGILGVLGCGSASTPVGPVERTFPGVPIVVAAVGDPQLLPTLAAQRADWEQRRAGRVEIRSEAIEPSQAAEADLLLFPGDRLGDLVDAGALAVLPDQVVQTRPSAKSKSEAPGEPGEGPAVQEDEDTLAFDGIIPAFRERVSRYGEDRMGLPYGGSALVLVYRRDAVASEAVREAGLGPGPPTTWEGLDRLAQALHGRDWDGDGQPEAGIALALGADPEGLGDATFLARALGTGLHPYQISFLFDAETMTPRIASPPFVEALKSLVGLKEAGPEGMAEFDAEAARAAFRAGEVALLIDRAERAERWTDRKQPMTVGVAPLPGSARVFDPDRRAWESVSTPHRPSYLPLGGGWLVGLSTGSSGPQREAALDFLRYLVGPETSGRIRTDRAFTLLPVRSAQVGQGLPDPRWAPGVDSRQWATAVGQTLATNRVEPGLRIPDAAGYLADLSQARVSAARGEPAETALKTAAASWDDRTDRLGRDRQRWHYRRSLNALPTSHLPPPRDQPHGG